MHSCQGSGELRWAGDRGRSPCHWVLPRASAAHCSEGSDKTGGLPADVANRTIREQVGEVPFFFGGLQVFVQIEPSGSVVMSKVVGRASIDSKEFVESMAIWAEFPQVAQMPLTDQRGFVAVRFQQ